MTDFIQQSVADFILVVDERKTVALDTIEISFLRKDGQNLPGWEPGSHIDLHLQSGLTRQYSLVPDSTGRGRWVVTILIEEDGRGGSRYINENLVPGAEVNASGIRNHFGIVPAPKFLFIAGGIGITPILSMIDFAERESIPWELNYLGRSELSMAYKSELISKFGDKVHIFAKDKGQRIDVLNAVEKADAECHVYCCGPENLMLAVEEAIGASDIGRCHVERFRPKSFDSTEADSDFEVYFQKSDIELVVPADESIFMAADFAGIELEGDCMEGTCGSCETRVISGAVEHRDSILNEEARRKNETMMICVSRARGRLVLDL